MNPTDEIELLLLVQELREVKNSLTRKNMIVDSQIEALKKTDEELRKTISELRNELVQFRRDRQICGRLNILADHSPGKVNQKEIQDKGPHDTENEDINKKLSNWH